MDANLNANDEFSAGTQAWCVELGSVASAIEKINKVFVGLAPKRVTLEEKLIKRYLHELTQTLGSIIVVAHKQLAAANLPGNEELLVRLAAATNDLNNCLSELLKVMGFDLNFLEQYFEHDFYGKLSSDLKLLDRFNLIYKNISG